MRSVATTAWGDDVVAPLIRDAGVRDRDAADRRAVRMILNGQMGRSGSADGRKDLHIGNFDAGVLPPPPLTISTMTASDSPWRSSFAARTAWRCPTSARARPRSASGTKQSTSAPRAELPAIFCVENNQTALSTPVDVQSAARVFAEKAAGYGIPGITIDGTDPDAIASAFAWAAARARDGAGPALIELIAMRMCGHAHHDDMLYLGRDPSPSWDYTPPTDAGYADAASFAFWASGFQLRREAPAERVIGRAISPTGRPSQALVAAEARHDRLRAGRTCQERRRRGERRATSSRSKTPPAFKRALSSSAVADAPAFDPKGAFLEAVMQGVGRWPDPASSSTAASKLGNAFSCCARSRRSSAPDLERASRGGGALGVYVGALANAPDRRIQFNDFVATGFSQLVDNAAKVRYRWGGSVPMVVRMPGRTASRGTVPLPEYGSVVLPHARLKIVCPSTPRPARSWRRRSPIRPVLYYEHIALYRRRRSNRSWARSRRSDPAQEGRHRRANSHLAIVSYGACVHCQRRGPCADDINAPS